MFNKTTEKLDSLNPHFKTRISTKLELNGNELVAIESLIEILKRSCKYLNLSTDDKTLLEKDFGLAEPVISELHTNFIADLSREIIPR